MARAIVMKRPMRADMPIALTLPLHFDLRLRKRRGRRLAVAVLLVLAAALVAASFLRPSNAERDNDASIGADSLSERLATLDIGDELIVEGCGSASTYEVAGLDIVDRTRVELAPDFGEDVVVLVADWPFEGGAIRDRWQYVVTARPRF